MKLKKKDESSNCLILLPRPFSPRPDPIFAMFQTPRPASLATSMLEHVPPSGEIASSSLSVWRQKNGLTFCFRAPLLRSEGVCSRKQQAEFGAEAPRNVHFAIAFRGHLRGCVSRTVLAFQMADQSSRVWDGGAEVKGGVTAGGHAGDGTARCHGVGIVGLTEMVEWNRSRGKRLSDGLSEEGHLCKR